MIEVEIVGAKVARLTTTSGLYQPFASAKNMPTMTQATNGDSNAAGAILSHKSYERVDPARGEMSSEKRLPG